MFVWYRYFSVYLMVLWSHTRAPRFRRSKGTVAVAVPSALFLRAKVCLDDTKSRLITIPSKVLPGLPRSDFQARRYAKRFTFHRIGHIISSDAKAHCKGAPAVTHWVPATGAALYYRRAPSKKARDPKGVI